MKWLIFIALLLGLTDCGTGTDRHPSETPDEPLSSLIPLSEAGTITEANNQFALGLYANLKNTEDKENIFFSPYSISTAMAMVYEGARHETADEIQSVFHFPTDPSVRRSSFETVQSYLNRKGTPYQLNTANALWVEKSFPLQNTFKTVITKFYKGDAFNADFKRAAEKERNRINEWVKNETMNKITNLFPKGSLDSLTRLVLTNAIYFKGKWEEPFEKSQTEDENFWLDENQTEKVPMMKKTDFFNYAQTEELQILEIPYEGRNLSMLILLPRGKTYRDLKFLEESLTTDNMTLWKNSLKRVEVDVSIPKFTFKRSYKLKENLREMGISLAFDLSGLADFSGISEVELYVDKIFHKAFVDVNEEGTEAAATTGIAMEFMSAIQYPPPKVFKADHPFIFLIQERTTGYILFMGKVASPAK